MDRKILKKKLLRFFGNILLIPLVNVLCKSLKFHELNKPLQNEESNQRNFVFAFWHGTMLAPWYKLREYSPSTIISQSKDGELLAKLLSTWNYEVKRGSSSRDGKLVLEELVQSAILKRSIAITPDGPRGPEKEIKAGTVVISKRTQIPIILIGVGYSKKHKLNSWDKFQIPYFFSHVSLVYSNPIFIEENLSYEETSEIMKKLEFELNNYQNQAEKLC